MPVRRQLPLRSARRPAVSSRSTADRLVDAAGHVFARDGLEAATTRAIAREAGLNEVTLFRHFGSKEGVLAAVVRRAYGPGEQPPRMPDSGDLRADLRKFTVQYETVLRVNLPLVRTFIGEIHRHRDYASRVLKGIFQPLRADLIARLKSAQAAGEILARVEAEIAADLLSGMILSGVLRDTSALKPRRYPAIRYRTACVDVLWAALTAGKRAVR